MNKPTNLWLFLYFFVFGSGLLAENLYKFSVEHEFMALKDGTKISLTYYRPVPKREGKKFPVLLELLPYRKDDNFAQRDYGLYPYFARRGFVMAKADIRGTGSSFGRIPDREYSEQELDDAEEIISRLAVKDWSDGNIGMWGISWGGFNAIQAAMRNPPALKAILAVDASDDLYHDDVHYIDGIFHTDEYELSIENDNLMPRSKDYKIDEEYFRDRFDRYPWFLVYKKQQRDGKFWRGNSLRWQYDKIKIPVYLIGGLADGYRDSVPRMLSELKVPVRAVIGPWNHAWPHDGEPGPVHEWRDEICAWWNFHFHGTPSPLLDRPPLSVFVRSGDPPDAGLKTASGKWIGYTRPVKPGLQKKLFLTTDSLLSGAPGTIGIRSLAYRATSGTVAGYWWGEATGDMGRDDADCLLFDGEPQIEPLTTVGFPHVKLRVSTDAPLAHWMVRLEDVGPDGRVALVTGGAINGSQRNSRLDPSHFKSGEPVDIEIDMHFTTWVFQPGHRIRLAVTNAQFPMLWPTPHAMTTQVHLGQDFSSLDLPLLNETKTREISFPKPEPEEKCPFGRYFENLPPRRHRVIHNLETGETLMEWERNDGYEWEGRVFRSFEKTKYSTSDRNPAHSTFSGKAGVDIDLRGRTVSTRVSIDVVSDARFFRIVFKRKISENGQKRREKTWVERIPRNFQ